MIFIAYPGVTDSTFRHPLLPGIIPSKLLVKGAEGTICYLTI